MGSIVNDQPIVIGITMVPKMVPKMVPLGIYDLSIHGISRHPQWPQERFSQRQSAERLSYDAKAARFSCHDAPGEAGRPAMAIVRDG